MVKFRHLLDELEECNYHVYLGRDGDFKLEYEGDTGDEKHKEYEDLEVDHITMSDDGYNVYLVKPYPKRMDVRYYGYILNVYQDDDSYVPTNDVYLTTTLGRDLDKAREVFEKIRADTQTRGYEIYEDPLDGEDDLVVELRESYRSLPVDRFFVRVYLPYPERWDKYKELADAWYQIKPKGEGD